MVTPTHYAGEVVQSMQRDFPGPLMSKARAMEPNAPMARY